MVDDDGAEEGGGGMHPDDFLHFDPSAVMEGGGSDAASKTPRFQHTESLGIQPRVGWPA